MLVDRPFASGPAWRTAGGRHGGASPRGEQVLEKWPEVRPASFLPCPAFMMTTTSWNELRRRAREDGLGSLADVELVALLLASPSDALGCAQRLLDETGGLAALDRAGAGMLGQIEGLGAASVSRLLASVELGRRVRVRAARTPRRLATPSAVAALVVPRIDPPEQEHMWVVSLDGRSGLRGCRRVAQGGHHGCAVSAREILRAALGDAASGFVLVHNHPSGDPQPSPEDVAVTRAVDEAARVVGVPLLDHVVVTASGDHVSLLDLGVVGSR